MAEGKSSPAVGGIVQLALLLPLQLVKVQLHERGQTRGQRCGHRAALSLQNRSCSQAAPPLAGLLRLKVLLRKTLDSANIKPLHLALGEAGNYKEVVGILIGIFFPNL